MTSTLKFDRWFNTNDELVADGTSGFPNGRNLLYNGAMQVAQRGTSETGISSSGYYTADRWNFDIFSFGVWTQTVESDGPTGSGFTKSLKVECTTADSSPGANNFLLVSQKMEGQDLQGLKKGTSDAESLTLSFWVKSNVAGTYIVEFQDNDNTRTLSQSYSVLSSDAWEKKTITISGDATGAFGNDNGTSFVLNFWLGAGSDFSSGTLNTSWAGRVQANRAAGQTNLAASTSNYWQVTGVQLETGTVATGFDHKPYGVELAECQRYYQQSLTGINGIAGFAVSFGTTEVRGFLPLTVSMRDNPTVITAPIEWRGDGTLVSTSSVSFVRQQESVVKLQMNLASPVTASTAGGYEGDWELEAEL